MQLAADADQLRSVGVPVHRDGHLILANNETTAHALRGSVPVFYAAQTGSAAVLEAHRLGATASAWGDPRRSACLKCADCEAEMPGGPITITLLLPNSAAARAASRSGESEAESTMPAGAPLTGASTVSVAELAARRASMASLAQAWWPLRSITHGIALMTPLLSEALKKDKDTNR